MNIIRYLLVVILPYFIGGGAAYGASREAKESDVRLCDLLSDPACDLNKPVEIKGDSIEKIVKIIDQDNSNYICDESFTNIVMLAFSQWCGRFVSPNMEFVVFRLPHYFEGDNVFDIRSEHGGYYSNYVDYGNRIVYDPYVEKVSLNEYLLDRKTVVMARQGLSDGRGVVALDAVIPYDSDYFWCKVGVQYGYKINSPETEDNNLKGEMIGKKLPNWLKSNGIINWAFFVYGLTWAYDGMWDLTIQRIDIDPYKDNITIKSLFYDNEMSQR